MIAPPLPSSIICRAQARSVSITPVRLTAITFSQCSISWLAMYDAVRSSPSSCDSPLTYSALETPAAATTTSSRPNSATARSASASLSASADVSQPITTARRPSASTAATVSAARSGSRSASSTSAPSSAKRIAHAAPIPLAPPVITAVLPAS